MYFGSKFQTNLNNFDIKFNWGFDGCARWRRPAQGPWQGSKEFKKLVSKLELGSNFQKQINSLETNLNLGLDGCVRWRRPAQSPWQRNFKSCGIKLI